MRLSDDSHASNPDDLPSSGGLACRRGECIATEGSAGSAPGEGPLERVERVATERVFRSASACDAFSAMASA